MTVALAAPKSVFKICATGDWAAAMAVGSFRGSADDLRDGYIHLSTAEQATETARKYFSHQHNLLLVAFDTAQLGAPLRWEASRGGALFPHFYAALPATLAVAVAPLQLNSDGAPDVAAALRNRAMPSGPHPT